MLQKSLTKFVKMIEQVCINQYESQMSFDVVSLIIAVPLQAAKTIVLDRLGKSSTLKLRRTLSIAESTEALDLCLHSSSFTCNSTMFKQVFGTPIGSPYHQ